MNATADVKREIRLNQFDSPTWEMFIYHANGIQSRIEESRIAVSRDWRTRQHVPSNGTSSKSTAGKVAFVQPPKQETHIKSRLDSLLSYPTI